VADGQWRIRHDMWWGGEAQTQTGARLTAQRSRLTWGSGGARQRRASPALSQGGIGDSA